MMKESHHMIKMDDPMLRSKQHGTLFTVKDWSEIGSYYYYFTYTSAFERENILTKSFLLNNLRWILLLSPYLAKLSRFIRNNIFVNC